MGSSTSQPAPFYIYPSEGIFKDSINSFFEVGYDEQILINSLTNDIIQHAQEDGNQNIHRYNLPNENVIADIMADSLTAATLNSDEEIWREVLVPLFAGTNDSKSSLHQLLRVISRFFKERTISYFDNEATRRLINLEILNSNYIHIIKTHLSFHRLSINKSSISKIQDEASLINLFPILKDKQTFFSPHHLYRKAGEKIQELFNSKPNDMMAHYLFVWGMLTSDIACLISSLKGFGMLMQKGNKEKFHNYFPCHQFAAFTQKISLTNSLNAWPENSFPSSVSVPGYNLFENPGNSLMSCDGNNVYILGAKATVSIISLSKNNIKYDERFKTLPLMILPKESEGIGIATSNGYAIINGPAMQKPAIFKLPNFDPYDEELVYDVSRLTRRCKVRPPLACDGKYIYSLDSTKRKLNVFSLNPPKIIHHHVIHLKPSERMLSSSDFIPKEKGFIMLANGTVISIIALNEESANSYQYDVRHFSLIDGMHICDTKIEQQWPLISVALDPWNRCYWSVAPEKNSVSIVKLQNLSALPLWFTEPTYRIYPQLSDVSSAFKNLRHYKSFFLAIADFLDFFSAQFNGLNVCSSVNNNSKSYSYNVAKFFAPCSKNVIHCLIESIEFFINVLETTAFIEVEVIKNVLLSLMKILDYNLKFFNPYIQNIPSLSSKTINSIIRLFKRIIKEKSLLFLHKSVYFIIINSFTFLFFKPTSEKSDLFLIMVKLMSKEMFLYLISSVTSCKEYSTVLTKKAITKYFEPILSQYVSNKKPSYKNEEIFNTYMRNLIYVMRANNLNEKPSSYDNDTSEAFFTFSMLMSEAANKYISSLGNRYHEKHFKNHIFTYILSKWLAMLQPFTAFTKLPEMFISFIQPLFFNFSEKLVQMKLDSTNFLTHSLKHPHKEISSINLMFYELYSLYLNFLTTLLDGGAELRDIIQYQWLIKATIEAGMNPRIVENLYQNIVSKTTNFDQSSRITKGFSFSILDENSAKQADLEIFAMKFADTNESHQTEHLMDYLYKKAPNPFNKKVSGKDRWIERLIIAAFTKQLGIASELLDISDRLEMGEQPVLSHFMKQLMEEVYRIRRKIRHFIQTAIQKLEIISNDCCCNCCEPTENKSDDYVEQIIKKSIFLLYIEPFMRYESERFETSFTEILKQLQNFVSAEKSIEDHFGMIAISKELRKRVTNGISLINDYLNYNKTTNIWTSFLIEQIASNGSILNYLSSLKASSAHKSLSHIMKLLDHLQKMIMDSTSSTFIVFYANICLSVAKISPIDALKPIEILIEALRKKYNAQTFRSYMSFIFSGLIALSQTNPEIKNNEKYQNFLASAVDLPEIGRENFSFTRICLKAGYVVQVTILGILDILQSSPPSMYHSAASLIYELLCKSRRKFRICNTILSELAMAISGADPSIMKKYDTFSIESKAGDKCKSSHSIIGCATEFLYICRKILTENKTEGIILTHVFDYVLAKFSPDNKNKEDFDNTYKFEDEYGGDDELLLKMKQIRKDYEYDMEVFKDENILYAVFAIISNSVAIDHVSSYIRNTLNNTIYYVEDIDEIKQEYIAWQLPITGESVPLHIKFGINFVPIPMIPFSTSMYTNYKLLFPHFRKALLSNSHSGLDFLILMSLRNYAGSQKFMNALFQENFSMKIPFVSYKDSTQFFMNILLCHLVQYGLGFNTPDETSLKFHQISPVNFTQNVTITPQKIKCSKGFHMFISTPVPTEENATLKLSIHSKSFDLGAFVPSTSEAGINYISICCRDGFLQNGEKAESSYKYEVNYDSNIGVSIKVNKKRIDKDILNNVTSPICFFVVLYDESKVRYYITSTLLDTSDPYSSESIEFDEDNYHTTILSMQVPMVEPKRNFLNQEDKGPIVIFPPEVVDEASSNFDLSLRKNTKLTMPTFRDESKKVVVSKSIKIIDNYLFSFFHNGIYYTDRPNQLLFQKLYTGEIIEFSHTAQSCSSLPIFTPNQFPLMPSIFVNYFSTGYIERCRNETINVLFIQFISSSTVPIDKIVNLFSIDLNSLLHHVIKLLVILEPLHFSNDSCFVNFFTINVLNPIKPPRLPSLHKYKFALHEILNYVDRSGNSQEFAELWFKTLSAQFHDTFYHSAQPNHPDAVVKKFVNSPIIIERFNIVGWFVSCLEFDHDHSFEVNGVKIAKSMKFCEGTKLTITFTKENPNLHLVAIPLLRDKNDTLDDTFFELVMSLKYFVIFVHYRRTILQNLAYFRSMVHILLFEAILTSSPFFYAYFDTVFDFLETRLPTVSTDIEGRYIMILNLLGIYLSHRRKIKIFLKEQKTLWNERNLLPLKELFPEFQSAIDMPKEYISNCTDSEKLKFIKFDMPLSNIPNKLTKNDNVDSLVNDIKRIFKRVNTIEGYPFHFLINDWAKYAIFCPVCDITVISHSIIQINFAYYFPKTIQIRLGDSSIRPEFTIAYDNSFSSDLVTFHANENIEIEHHQIFIKLTNFSWSTLSFAITSSDEKPIEWYISKFMNRFVDDVKLFATQWNEQNDQNILSCIDSKYFMNDELDFELLKQPEIFLRRPLKSYPLHVILLRAKFLMILNWSFSHYKIKFTNNLAYFLLPAISTEMKVKHFQNEVADNSNDYVVDIEIDRKAASDIRLGQSTDLSMTLISQMTRQYKDPSQFRRLSDQPWSVVLKGEPVRDAGGPARELVADLALDLCNPLCGLVIQTPNSRNDVGEMRDCVIPIASQRISGIRKKYRFAGALIAIAIRTGLVQQFNFPPLVWKYLISSQILIDDIYMIDQNYKILITTLNEALYSDMTNEEFVKRFNMRFCVVDSSGKEVPLTTRGRSEVVTHSNCGLYISLAQEFRINEMKSNLKEMRRGFWENLDFSPPRTVDWTAIEYAACGVQEITAEMIKKVTYMEKIPKESAEIFNKLIDDFSPKERSALLKFATSRSRLPPHSSNTSFMQIDSIDQIDTLPTASTCFHCLHMPHYTSYETAYRLFKVAIEYTGTFENS
ncbi:hypothetical protein TRFO_02536 [Tritrichomonas foetus]|uniref:HECT domain-containing protein n=1 Tax=Tritrichomonas foetus TaxID=1144522 RepID=A0A1J4L347_9EUKA|nr:hypothetical protein TRFO_02536 [Tritrichomonas foetus]|eukprot:OHT17504.1 hypothetical protein TRFO_02536 [Tritrichomonas foetus]